MWVGSFGKKSNRVGLWWLCGYYTDKSLGIQQNLFIFVVNIDYYTRGFRRGQSG